MNLSLLLAYMLAILLLLMTPGPVVALIMGTAARHGYRRAFATVVGTNAASLVLIALAALMLTGLVLSQSLEFASRRVAGFPVYWRDCMARVTCCDKCNRPSACSTGGIAEWLCGGHL